MGRVCCCTGIPPKEFPFKYGKDKEKHLAYLKQLKEKIELAIKKYGARHFISGLDSGTDLDFAAKVDLFKDTYKITSEYAIASYDYDYQMSREDVLRFGIFLKNADKLHFISNTYTEEYFIDLYRYMIDSSNTVIVVANGINNSKTQFIIEYAKSQGKRIEIIDLSSLN